MSVRRAFITSGVLSERPHLVPAAVARLMATRCGDSLALALRKLPRDAPVSSVVAALSSSVLGRMSRSEVHALALEVLERFEVSEPDLCAIASAPGTMEGVLHAIVEWAGHGISVRLFERIWQRAIVDGKCLSTDLVLTMVRCCSASLIDAKRLREARGVKGLAWAVLMRDDIVLPPDFIDAVFASGEWYEIMAVLVRSDIPVQEFHFALAAKHPHAMVRWAADMRMAARVARVVAAEAIEYADACADEAYESGEVVQALLRRMRRLTRSSANEGHFVQ
jgi:hypothetical protein